MSDETRAAIVRNLRAAWRDAYYTDGPLGPQGRALAEVLNRVRARVERGDT